VSNINSYCSWCYEKTNHKLNEQNYLRRNTYTCSKCSNGTVQCRCCDHMAKGQPNEQKLAQLKLSGIKKLSQSWDNELCAEHDGSIASFKKLTMQLDDITQYEKIFDRDVLNLAKAGKYAGYGALGAASAASLALSGGSSSPAVAAVLGNMGLLGTAGTGVAISSLSGAALTSASLAAIGGSMATGAAIISASGLALGGSLGGVVANRYHGEDKSFAIRKLRERSSQVKTIFINGFTQKNETDFFDWQAGQLAFDSTPTMYSVNWDSKSNATLGAAFVRGVGTPAAKSVLVAMAAVGGKQAAKRINPLAYLTMLPDIISNPWHGAMVRAAQTGVKVAEAISRTKGQKFNLVGHSLGCRVIYYVLVALGSKADTYINDVILLGGAVGRDDVEGWTTAVSAVDGKIYNCHSNQDMVLSKIYKIANAGLSDPIGINPIKIDNSKIENIKCDDFVESHMTWKKHYEKILGIIYPK